MFSSQHCVISFGGIIKSHLKVDEGGGYEHV